MNISIDIKLKCLDLINQGMNSKEVYDQYFSKVGNQTYASFQRSLRKWKNLGLASTSTLLAGTYPDFKAHGATVQVNNKGEVVQAWIKQGILREDQLAELLDSIKKNVKPIEVDICNVDTSMKMLEIPLYDMHFPLSDYRGTLIELLPIIEKDYWNEINIIIGQDLFHNDDFRGRTSSGRPIEKIDMVSAWEQARTFWYNVIKKSLEHSNNVKVIYSKGNHDESIAWTFIQMLKEMFPMVVFDDSMSRRKCIHWNGCFIGITHGCEIKSQNSDLRGQFTIDFSKEFADSTVREIHAGHLHHEISNDLYGVVIRRLSTSTPRDTWSDDEGYIGTHRRFMIFEWVPTRLKSIHYIEDTKIY